MDATERALIAAADEANARIASCHERVACPYCAAPVGEVCRSMNGGAGFVAGRHWQGKALKHPHSTRWQQETPAR